MIYKIYAVDILGRTVIHEVDVGDRKIELHAPDLRGISLENAPLNGADLRNANLSGVCLWEPACVGQYWTSRTSAALT